jgi:hypothetical protein
MILSKKEVKNLVSMMKSSDKENHYLVYKVLEDLDLEANLGEVLVIFRYGSFRLDEWEDDCPKVYDFIINKLHDYNGGWDSKPTTSDILSLLTKNDASKDSIELFLEYFMMNLGRMLDNMGYPTDKFELTVKLKDNGQTAESK